MRPYRTRMNCPLKQVFGQPCEIRRNNPIHTLNTIITMKHKCISRIKMKHTQTVPWVVCCSKIFKINFKVGFHDEEDHHLQKCSHQPQYLRHSNDILPTQWSDSLHWSQSNDDDNNCDHEMIRRPHSGNCLLPASWRRPWRPQWPRPCPRSLGDIVKDRVQKIRKEINIQSTKSGL